MQLTFTSLSAAVKTVTLAYPIDFAGKGTYEERDTALTEIWGKLSINDIWFDGACICQTHVDPKHPFTINLQCASFCWIMSFVMDGEFKASFDSVKYLGLKEGRHHTFFTPTLNAELAFDQPAKIFTICLTRKFVGKLLGKEHLKDALETGAGNTFTLVTKGDYRHTRLHIVIKDMMETGQTGYIRRIFLKSKILELLSLQLQQAESQEASPKGFNREDIARLQEAKAYIAQNMQTPCSLIELARKTGLNDFKLKKGFKALFGNTVFGYLYDVRMDTAYTLLQDDKSVSEVAELIGYKNPHHFTAAFKRKFGFLPSQVNKMQL